MQTLWVTFERRVFWALPWKSTPWWLMGGGVMLTILAAQIAAWVHRMPEMVATQTWGIIILVLSDGFTGVTVACLERKVSSHRMRTRSLAKIAQYVGLIALTGVVALVVKDWLPVNCGLTAVMAFEAVSIVENLYRLELVGGINLGPARPLLMWLGKFLDIPNASQPPEHLILTPQEAQKENPKP